MTRPRFGEALARFVTLSPHDVSEILEEQSSSRRRFGDIALAFGLCKPQHVWRAWWAQLSGAPERIDLSAVGVDAQALAYLPRALAVEYNVIPIRASGSQVVMAAAEGALMRAMEELPRRVKNQIKFVLADSRQIHQAIENYYAGAARENKTVPLAVPA
ncbi:MAG TPA: hypothetical protein VFE47_26440 [Tepidisphaeraceae bacterium]|jgi:type IV pilus assembly protein PilB|nr:hypothetical protein [Tepidisphaeraceae bacterium]